jgi:hypothetical protein
VISMYEYQFMSRFHAQSRDASHHPPSRSGAPFNNTIDSLTQSVTQLTGPALPMRLPHVVPTAPTHSTRAKTTSAVSGCRTQLHRRASPRVSPNDQVPGPRIVATITMKYYANHLHHK